MAVGLGPPARHVRGQGLGLGSGVKVVGWGHVQGRVRGQGLGRGSGSWLGPGQGLGLRSGREKWFSILGKKN